jgi:poly(3-hydroxybutyrate) depolymerase
MTGLRKTLAKLARLRRRWEKLLTAAQRSRAAQAGPARQQERLQEVASFGSNPGNLRMFVYAPDALPSDPALLVALHGCTQNAADFDRGTGWSTVADRFGFVVLYPEQPGPTIRKAASPGSCPTTWRERMASFFRRSPQAIEDALARLRQMNLILGQSPSC